MPEQKAMSAYDRGFTNGLHWVARCMRISAMQVEKPVVGSFERKRESSSEFIEAIVKSGQPHFAESLRSVAAAIDEIAFEIAEQKGSPNDAKSRGTPV
jgi:hypothetical protein